MHHVSDKCDMAISIDADLQDDINVIEQMIDKYYQGCNIVYGVRDDRSSDTVFKRFTAQTFYKLMQFLGVKSIYNHADFRLVGIVIVYTIPVKKEKLESQNIL